MGQMVVEDKPLPITGVLKLLPAAKPSADHELFKIRSCFDVLSRYDYFFHESSKCFCAQSLNLTVHLPDAKGGGPCDLYSGSQRQVNESASFPTASPKKELEPRSQP